MFQGLQKENKISSQEYKDKIDVLESKLGELQRICSKLKIPVMLVFEGVEACGKGEIISRLMKALDPRGFQVYPISTETEVQSTHPFLRQYWIKTPSNNRIAIYDRSWYQKVTVDVFEKEIVKQDIPIYMEEIRCFEKQLVDNHTCMLKFFLHINQKEQKKRMKKLVSDSRTKWRVTKHDWKKNKKFDSYWKLVEEVILATDQKEAPWHVISSMDKKWATIQIYDIVIESLEKKIKQYNQERLLLEFQTEKNKQEAVKYQEVIERLNRVEQIQNRSIQKTTGVSLDNIDLSCALEHDAYEQQLKRAQKKIRKLQEQLYCKQIPMVIGMEGWDAAGKGGAIKRLTEKMDPRGYAVIPISAPNEIEKSHHYFWRFWKEMPKNGHITIFDRTWYGRVLVERVEQLCTEEEWKRAYREINDMEQSLLNAGAIVVKFWIHVDQEEQKKRFQAREADPDKSWKMTEEDWRNRDKWLLYKEVVEEMIDKTSTKESPWVIIEGNNKLYARIKVLETVIKAMEQRLRMLE